MKSTDVPPKIREQVYKRDLGMCQMCGSRRNLHIHHILYRSQWRNGHRMFNLILLCEHCHREVHKDKGKYQPLLLSSICPDWYERIDKTDLSETVLRTLSYCNEKTKYILQKDFIKL